MLFVITFQFLKQLPSICLIVSPIFSAEIASSFQKIKSLREGTSFQDNKGDTKSLLIVPILPKNSLRVIIESVGTVYESHRPSGMS